MVMPWSFSLLCWLTGRKELNVLGPSAGGTAFLNPDAFCSPPAFIVAEWLLRSCSLAMRRCLDGHQSARCLLDPSLHRWASFLQHRLSILVARGRWEVPGPGLRAGWRPTGITPRPRLWPAAWRGRLQGPRLRCGGGRHACVQRGRLSRWSRSCLAARPPLRPIQVSPAARREGAACLGSARAQRAGSCQPRGVLGLPRGSGRGAGSRRSWEPAPVTGGGRRAWEPPAAPREPGWGWTCRRGWIQRASLSPTGAPGGGDPRLLSGTGAGLHTLRAPLHTPSHPTALRGLLVLCPGALGGGAALGWFDQGWGLVCGISLSTWSRVAAGLPERQMVAARGPAIRPSGRLFTRRHGDRKAVPLSHSSCTRQRSPRTATPSPLSTRAPCWIEMWDLLPCTHRRTWSLESGGTRRTGTRRTTGYLSSTSGCRTGQRNVTISGGTPSPRSSSRMTPC
ncbi:LIM domain-binding protein 1 isoform X1 [Mycteria americana]|uniref:LIM domain-binding protein 1 isoform X1 n=1 Tax=Mycteria americana TaxID=33587 RepID=UPI003F584176